MNCANHPQTQAVAYCRTCGKPLCESCKRDVRGVIYCEDCLAARVGQQSASAAEGQPVLPAPAFTSPAQPNFNPGGPNPAIAGLLSGFLPFGTGVMYCGEYMRALAHAGVFFGLIAIIDQVKGSADAFVGMSIAFWYFFMIFDSVRVAKAKQRGEPVPDLFGFGLARPAEPALAGGGPAPEEERSRSGVPIGALILIGLGVLFLAGNVWDFDWMAKFWPLILIAFGIRLFLRRQGRANRCHCVRCTAACGMGAAVLTTLGVLFLLQNVSYRFDFGRTWPLLLIVIGVVAFLRNSGPMEGHIEPNPPAPPLAPQNEVHHG
ncbi:MAG TPA: B-box zinc finger protein [Candidatus Angelobacter sp.]|nr:B-box zinc finger protein [Candidatus Angelobacter sp.]